jgi:hypothetical protein
MLVDVIKVASTRGGWETWGRERRASRPVAQVRRRGRVEKRDVLPISIVGVRRAPDPHLADGDEARAPRLASEKDLRRNVLGML